ncbi:hypothetical protein Tco_1268180, partial [Tanacetum coccineum]
VMDAPTIHVSAEENLGDPIDIRVDIIHPEPVDGVNFPAAAVVSSQAQHMEAIRGIQEHLLGVPIQEELTALRIRVDIIEAENASLRARIKTTEAIKKITRNRERQVRMEMEQQLAAVQESQRQDRENFRKLQELITREVRFGKWGKLNPRYVGPSKVMEKVGSVAYKLELPQELSSVHHTFHVSNLKKCYTDEPLAVPFNGFHIEDKLHFIEEPAEIMDRKVKRLKQSRIRIVKVRWNTGRGPEFT